jgi:hypothetical protein
MRSPGRPARAIGLERSAPRLLARGPCGALAAPAVERATRCRGIGLRGCDGLQENPSGPAGGIGERSGDCRVDFFEIIQTACPAQPWVGCNARFCDARFDTHRDSQRTLTRKRSREPVRCLALLVAPDTSWAWSARSVTFRSIALCRATCLPHGACKSHPAAERELLPLFLTSVPCSDGLSGSISEKRDEARRTRPAPVTDYARVASAGTAGAAGTPQKAGCA